MMIRMKPATFGILGLTMALSGWAYVHAQDAKKADAHVADAKGDEDLQNADRLIKSYQSYRERVVENNESVRKDIDRLIKEASELNEKRHQMLVLAASLRAKSASSTHSESSQVEHREALNRELRALHSQLLQEVEQSKAQLSQLASQLEGFRTRRQAHQNGVEANGKNEAKAKQSVSPVDPG